MQPYFDISAIQHASGPKAPHSFAPGVLPRLCLCRGEEERQKTPDRCQEACRKLPNEIQKGRPPPHALYGKDQGLAWVGLELCPGDLQSTLVIILDKVSYKGELHD